MNILETTISNAQPMTTFDGDVIPGSGIVHKFMKSLDAHCLTVIAQTSENFLYRDSGVNTYWSFTIGQRSYSIKIEITRAARKQVQITFNSMNPCDYLTPSDLWEGAV